MMHRSAVYQAQKVVELVVVVGIGKGVIIDKTFAVRAANSVSVLSSSLVNWLSESFSYSVRRHLPQAHGTWSATSANEDPVR